MSERAAYSRVYWTIVDDEKFAHVYDDDAALAAWLRLLLIADQAWPASAHLPTSCRPKAVKVLIGAGLVTELTGGRYRIKGLDAERGRRREAASIGTRTVPKRDPSATQTGPERDPDGIQTRGLRRDETRRDETSPPAGAREATNGTVSDDEDGYETVVRWLASRKAWVDSPKLQTDLARLVHRNGAVAVLGAMNALLPDVTEAAQFIYGARNLLHPLPTSKPRDVQRENEAENDRKHHEAELARTRRLIEEQERRAAS